MTNLQRCKSKLRNFEKYFLLPIIGPMRSLNCFSMLSIDATNVIKVVTSLEEGLEDEFEVCFERDDFF